MKQVILKIIVAGGNFVATVVEENSGRAFIRDWRAGKLLASTVGDDLGSWAVATSSIQAMCLMELETMPNMPAGPQRPGQLPAGVSGHWGK